MSRVADELGIDPFEFRFKNANRVGDTSPNRIRYGDPSTVDVLHAIADSSGHELSPASQQATRERREGEWLPDHLVSQISDTEDH